jgi:hypothetical protein
MCVQHLCEYAISQKGEDDLASVLECTGYIPNMCHANLSQEVWIWNSTL